MEGIKEGATSSSRGERLVQVSCHPRPGLSACTCHLPMEKPPATAGRRLWGHSVPAPTDPIHQTSLLETTNECRTLFPLAVCPGPPLPIHIHSLAYTDGQTPTETRLPPPSCSGAYADSQCLQHVMSHLSWTCSFPLPTAHTSPQARLPLPLSLCLSLTHLQTCTLYSLLVLLLSRSVVSDSLQPHGL